MDNPVGANAGQAPEKPALKVTSLTDEEFIARRLEKKSPKAAAPKPPPEGGEKPEDETKEPNAEDGSEEKPEAPSAQEVLSKAKSGNLDELTREELDVLSKELGSRAVARFGELTARSKTAEAEVAQLRAELLRREQETKGNAPEPIRDNPFAASISDKKELVAKEREIHDLIEWAEDKLDDAADLKADDVVAEVEGTQYTKQQLRERLRRARKARDEYLPDVGNRIAATEQARLMRTNLDGQLRREIPWLENKEDNRTKAYEATLADPVLKEVEKISPQLAARLPYLAAHAANSLSSIYARREVPIDEGAAEKAFRKPKDTPPENPAAGAASSRSPEASKTKALKDLETQFKESGSEKDWVSLRAARMGQRKNVR